VDQPRRRSPAWKNSSGFIFVISFGVGGFKEHLGPLLIGSVRTGHHPPVSATPRDVSVARGYRVPVGLQTLANACAGATLSPPAARRKASVCFCAESRRSSHNAASKLTSVRPGQQWVSNRSRRLGSATDGSIACFYSGLNSSR
jgi:hypothetical protein